VRRASHRRRRQQLGNPYCTTSPRWVRGSVGTLLGTLLGGMIGGGVALAITTSQFELTEPVSAVNRVKNMALLTAGAATLGAISGLAVGAWKPEC